jgi:hypothetical protein
LDPPFLRQSIPFKNQRGENLVLIQMCDEAKVHSASRTTPNLSSLAYTLWSSLNEDQSAVFKYYFEYWPIRVAGSNIVGYTSYSFFFVKIQ